MKFDLRGLRADNLQAFLALLGVLRVVDLQCPQWRARARWRNEAAGGLAEIEIEADAVSESDFVAATAKGARELLASLAESIPKTGAVEDAETVVKMNHENPQAAFVGVFAAPPPPSMEKTKSPLFLLSGTQTCRGKAAELAELSDSDFKCALLLAELSDSDSERTLLLAELSDSDSERALLHAWLYKTGKLQGFNWDPLDRREHARWHKEPKKDKNFAVEKGGLALAICGWPSFMPAPKTKGKRKEIDNAAPGWLAGTRKLRKESAKWQTDLSWPLWESFADLPEIEATLADNFWRADEIDRADMKARGVWRVMRTVRMRGREKTEASRKFFGWAKQV